MGNRLSLLPLPSFVGGTVECGPEPTFLPQTHNDYGFDFDDDDDDNEHDLYAAGVYRGNNNDPDARSQELNNLNIDEARGFGSPVAYASTFFLRGLESTFYLYSSDGQTVGQTKIVDATSLITFHSQGAEQINFRGDKDLVNVEDGHVVTIYANIGSGKYLCPGAQSTRRLHWKSNAQHMAKEPRLYEWQVRRYSAGQNADADEQRLQRAQRSPSYFRRKLKVLQTFGLRRPSLDETSMQRYGPGLSPATGGGERGASTMRRHSQSDLHAGSRSRTPPQGGSGSNDARQLTARPNLEFQLLSQHQHYSARSQTAPSERSSTEEVQLSDADNLLLSMTSELNDRTLCFGDIVTLESCSRPGCFLVAKPGHAHLQLSSIEEGLFVVAPPQLKHLVRLSGNAQPPERLTQLDAPKKISKEDAEWLRLLQRLPHDLVYKILQYKGRWVRTARLVSKDWCRAAEQHVFGIRVNGEYAAVSTLEERRHLLDFMLRCRHLTSLTLRNLDDLLDEEVAQQIMKCKFLRKLALGGCRRLTDEAFVRIDILVHLTHLNVATTQVTDEFLDRVVRSCPKLENLNLYGCKQISITGIKNVLKLESLQSLNIRGTSLDKATADRLQRTYLQKQVLVGAALPDGVYG
mmetsp:Transcript_13903/g.27003  ORF Transcript_13903/g.27003 Transcript_13903/m.27003 type:complete len:633 (+) Transcript_13903:628-2526(+)|eukprot:CAMPEP_0171569446 /NCGR_PEP_ID=MMETSP0961-20121227/2351_1 /TAXON_ID=87120 /ORGANISM="Aurantiochytrium limacinum, Strain ATCCMYA-1381" /LENGTH=632 /DNA_ID=CAMNT_0012123741 /DNA_START=543 /DNA_END=2441 /DNA_ORIENTATION=+